ncbi:MAG: hypothetical protein KF723_18650 [Rhizobiaceae bacterium]|nr:hypothetical protein [Rhizobiaceae bacterium]
MTRASRPFRRRVAITATAVLCAMLAACGGPGGRCGLLDKGYPLCGL